MGSARIVIGPGDGNGAVADFIGALKSLITKASMVTTPDAEKKNLWPHALEAHRALPPVDPKQFITLWGKGPLKAFEGCAQRAQIGGGVQGLPEAHVRVHWRDLPEAILPLLLTRRRGQGLPRQLRRDAQRRPPRLPPFAFARGEVGVCEEERCVRIYPRD